MFQDITTLLLDHNAFKDAVDIFVDRYRDMDISVVAGNLTMLYSNFLCMNHPFRTQNLEPYFIFLFLFLSY